MLSMFFYLATFRSIVSSSGTKQHQHASHYVHLYNVCEFNRWHHEMSENQIILIIYYFFYFSFSCVFIFFFYWAFSSFFIFLFVSLIDYWLSLFCLLATLQLQAVPLSSVVCRRLTVCVYNVTSVGAALCLMKTWLTETVCVLSQCLLFFLRGANLSNIWS